MNDTPIEYEQALVTAVRLDMARWCEEQGVTTDTMRLDLLEPLARFLGSSPHLLGLIRCCILRDLPSIDLYMPDLRCVWSPTLVVRFIVWGFNLENSWMYSEFSHLLIHMIFGSVLMESLPFDFLDVSSTNITTGLEEVVGLQGTHLIAPPFLARVGHHQTAPAVSLHLYLI